MKNFQQELKEYLDGFLKESEIEYVISETDNELKVEYEGSTSEEMDGVLRIICVDDKLSAIEIKKIRGEEYRYDKTDDNLIIVSEDIWNSYQSEVKRRITELIFDDCDIADAPDYTYLMDGDELTGFEQYSFIDENEYMDFIKDKCNKPNKIDGCETYMFYVAYRDDKGIVGAAALNAFKKSIGDTMGIVVSGYAVRDDIKRDFCLLQSFVTFLFTKDISDIFGGSYLHMLDVVYIQEPMLYSMFDDVVSEDDDFDEYVDDIENDSEEDEYDDYVKYEFGSMWYVVDEYKQIIGGTVADIMCCPYHLYSQYSFDGPLCFVPGYFLNEKYDQNKSGVVDYIDCKCSGDSSEYDSSWKKDIYDYIENKLKASGKKYNIRKFNIGEYEAIEAVTWSSEVKNYIGGCVIFGQLNKPEDLKMLTDNNVPRFVFISEKTYRDNPDEMWRSVDVCINNEISMIPLTKVRRMKSVVIDDKTFDEFSAGKLVDRAQEEKYSSTELGKWEFMEHRGLYTDDGKLFAAGSLYYIKKENARVRENVIWLCNFCVAEKYARSISLQEKLIYDFAVGNKLEDDETFVVIPVCVDLYGADSFGTMWKINFTNDCSDGNYLYSIIATMYGFVKTKGCSVGMEYSEQTRNEVFSFIKKIIPDNKEYVIEEDSLLTPIGRYSADFSVKNFNDDYFGHRELMDCFSVLINDAYPSDYIDISEKYEEIMNDVPVCISPLLWQEARETCECVLKRGILKSDDCDDLPENSFEVTEIDSDEFDDLTENKLPVELYQYNKQRYFKVVAGNGVAAAFEVGIDYDKNDMVAYNIIFGENYSYDFVSVIDYLKFIKDNKLGDFKNWKRANSFAVEFDKYLYGYDVEYKRKMFNIRDFVRDDDEREITRISIGCKKFEKYLKQREEDFKDFDEEYLDILEDDEQ